MTGVCFPTRASLDTLPGPQRHTGTAVSQMHLTISLCVTVFFQAPAAGGALRSPIPFPLSGRACMQVAAEKGAQVKDTAESLRIAPAE